MNCDFCQDWIQQQLDGGDGAATPELQSHLAECARCATLHTAGQRLNEGLRRLAPPCPPVELMNRLVAGVLQDQRAQRQRRRRVAVLWSVAASLLIGTAALALIRSFGLPFETNRPQPPVVARRTLPQPEPPPNVANVSVRETVTEAGSALAALTTRTADETVGQSRLLMPVVTGPTLDELEMPPALEPTRSYLEASQGVTVALEPVTSSARRALDLFRRDLPHVEH